MRAALQGDRGATRDFFQAFLVTPCFVPRRHQLHPLSDSPPYPDEFLDILGVSDNERVIVPVFSSPDFISEWSGASFEYRSMSGLELLKLVPDMWWIVLNPGQEIDKEFSPWEIAELRSGSAGIEEVLNELLDDDSIEPLTVKQLEEGEFSGLRLVLQETAATFPDVTQIRILKEERRASGEQQGGCATLLVSVDTCAASDELGKIRETFQRAIDVCQIGAEPCRLFVSGRNDSSPLAGLFRSARPVYTGRKEAIRAGFLFPDWLRSILRWRSR